MRRLALLLTLLVPSFAFAQLGGNADSSGGGINTTTGDAAYVNVSGDTMTGLLSLSAGVLEMTETTTPACTAGKGCIYTTTANDLRFVDGAGDDHAVHGFPVYKSYSTGPTSSGAHYIGGFYDAPATDIDLTNASLTATLGNASDDEPWAAHAFVVCAGDGATDGSDLVLTVSGTSITDAGVRTVSDSEVVLADALLAACATDAYAETAKKWLGQITYTLSSTAGGTFQWTGNIGWSKYEDFNNNDFSVVGFEAVGHAGASTSLDVELMHHSATGWTYSAAAFDPGNGVIAQMSVDHATDVNVDSGEYFAYKRSNLTTAVSGSASEGTIIRVTAGANNALEHADFHIAVEF